MKCSVENCERDSSRAANGRRGMCSAHYQRVRRHGDPFTVKETPSPAIDWIAEHSDYDGDDCLKWPFHIGKDGYGRVHRPLCGTLTTASNYMCHVAHGPKPSQRHEAAHSCGNGNLGCTNPRHLYWATPEKNQQERVVHGTSNRGERQHRSKLTKSDVRAIRRRATTESQKSIARDFGIDPSTVSNIVRRKKWAWLD